MKIFAIILFSFIFLNSFAANAGAVRHYHTVISYGDWQHKNMLTNAVSDRIIIVRSYFSPKPPSNIIEDVKDTVYTYALGFESPALLVWTRVAIDGKDAIARFYKKENNAWVLVDAAELKQNSPKQPNGKTILFTENSEFGKIYKKLWCGEKKCEINPLPGTSQKLF